MLDALGREAVHAVENGGPRPDMPRDELESLCTTLAIMCKDNLRRVHLLSTQLKFVGNVEEGAGLVRLGYVLLIAPSVITGVLLGVGLCYVF